MTDQSEKPVLRLDVSTRLAYDRTRLACERTMLAWVRTATALISFGFSIYSFFQFQLKDQREHLISPREVGLFMITCGLASLVAGAVQHMLNMRHIRAQWPDAPRSPAAVLAGVMALLGLTILIATLARN